MQRATLNLDQVCDYLGVSKVYARRQIWSKRWPHVRFGRALRMTVEDVQRILEASRIPADPAKAAPGALADRDIQDDLAQTVSRIAKQGKRRGR